MQSDDLDKKIQEAAEHHHPTYDEGAWQKMEKLLDVHLPQRKERKRRFFYLFLFSLLLTGGVYMLTGNSRNNSDSIAEDVAIKIPEQKTTTQDKTAIHLSAKENTIQKEASKETNTNTTPFSTGRKDNPEHDLIEGNNEPLAAVNNFNKGSQKNNPIGVTKKDQATANGILKRSGRSGKIITSASDISRKKTEADVNTGVSARDGTTGSSKVNTDPAIGLAGSSSTSIPEVKKTAAEDKIMGEEKPANSSATVIHTKQAAKHALALTVSGGFDVSGLRINQAGRQTMVYGLGLKYELSNRFTVRTGFYTGKKIYSANPDDYHPPSNFWTYYPDLKKIDADCRVSEIPVSVGYKFGRSPNHTWFASLGLSSFFMKRETYNYESKTPGGLLSYREITIKNKNNHYFSIATLSAGYERKLNNTLSIIAEPYIKVPFTGIGYGNIRLNSAGVLFTVGINPFNKK